MSAEAIRARYLDAIAMQQMGADLTRWRTASEALRIAARGLAEPIVAALEAAGLLPVTEVRQPMTTEVSSGLLTRQVVVGMQVAYLTDWRETDR